MRSFLLLLFLFCGTLFAQQKPDTVFTLGKVGKAPVIDGKITPGEWKDAASTAALVNYVNNKAGSRFASVAVAADQAAREVGDAPEEEEYTPGTEQGRHHVDHVGHLRRVAGQL